MSLVSILHELVCEDARLWPTNDHELHLKETDASASLKKVILDLAKHERFACVALDFRVKSGIRHRPSCLSDALNPVATHPLRAACDALLCIEHDAMCHLIHIELKSGNDRARAIQQLRNSRCFSRFLRELAEHWYCNKPRECKEWFVLLTSDKKLAARKRKTSLSRDSRPPSERPSNDPCKPTIFSVLNEQRIHVGKFFG